MSRREIAATSLWRHTHRIYWENLESGMSEFAAMESAQGDVDASDFCEFCPMTRCVMLLDGQNACSACRSECVTECSSCGDLVPDAHEHRELKMVAIFAMGGGKSLIFSRCDCGGQIPLMVDRGGSPCDPTKGYVGLTIDECCAPGWAMPGEVAS